ncbi:MAG: hypothetical protein LBV39_06460, partial [Bacteroidales bacterium]|nr:hypothetical protein [Bacteroidales bacterium]
MSGCHSTVHPDESHPCIVAYTSGIVSILSPVRIVLTDDANGSSPQVGEPLKDGIFKFSPSVSGKAHWISDNTIEFTPDEAFQAGQEYVVKFKVGEVIDVGNAPKTFTFIINTIVPTFYHKVDGLSLYNKRLPNLYYLSGSITTSDYIPADKVTMLLKAVSDKGKPIIKWEHDYENHQHFFRIDSIQAAKNKYDIHLLWDGNSIGYDYKNEDIITILGENEFGLIDIQVIHSPDQYVQCTFSEALLEKQRFGDYISLSDNLALRFSVELNILKIYPTTRETGTLTLSIRKGLKSYAGKSFSENIERELIFEQLKPAVKFVGKGVILPNSNGLNVTFQAVNYKAVDVEIYRIYESNILQFLQINKLDESDEMYRVGKNILNKRISLSDKKAVNLSVWNSFSLDLAELISPEPGAIYRIGLTGRDKIEDSSDDDDDDYYYDGYYKSYRDRHRNILATDIGLTAKSGDDGKEIYVLASNLITTDPINSVQVTAYDHFNQKVGEGMTDKDGLIVLHCSEKADVLVAQQGKQKSYLKLDYNSLSLSNFDVSGTDAQSGLKGFIYGERGVWRPGDTIFLAFMLEDKNKVLPANHPVSFELYNPNNQTISKQVKTSGVNGLYRFTTPTSADALTGNWEARIEVGGKYFSKTLKVETVKPNRLKIDLTFDNMPFLSSEGISGTMSVHWLHGAVARNLEARITTRISKAETTFKNFADYTFEDRSVSFYSEEKTLLESHLNENGELSFSKDLDVEASPGKLRVFLSTRVFEEGGDFSINEMVTTYSPYKSYIGIKAPQGDGYYKRLEIGAEQIFDVATLKETGEPVSRRNVKVDVYNVGWSWWWSSMRGDASYSSGSYSTPSFSTTINTQNGKGEFKHTWSQSGYYIIKMTDPESGHISAIPVYASYPYWYGDDEDASKSGATLLQLSSAKPSYNIGEEAVITFPAAEGAKALVSIESGSKIRRTFWVSCKDANGRVTIPATADMVPNVYVHISLIQPHARTTNDAPIRL